MEAKFSLPEEFADQVALKVLEKIKPMILELVGRLEGKLDDGQIVKREMNVKQLADYLNVKPKWIQRKTNLRNNPIPHTKNGKYLTFRIKDVLEWRDRMNGRC